MADFTANGILFWSNLFAPKLQKNKVDRKYEATILLHESDPKLQEIKRYVEDLKAAFPGGWDKDNHCALVECSVAKSDTLRNPIFKGYWAVSGKAKEGEKPSVAMMDRTPVIDQALVYKGADVWSIFDLYSYSDGNSGIFCTIRTVVFTGEPGALGRVDDRPTADQLYDRIPGMGASTPTGSETASTGSETASTGSEPSRIMIGKAEGFTYESLIKIGWTDASLIEEGMMQAPTPTRPPGPSTPPKPSGPKGPPKPSTSPASTGSETAPRVMLPAANGQTYEHWSGMGMTDQMMINAGLMAP